MEKRVGISIDSSGVKQGFDDLRKSAEITARDIVKNSRSYSTSYKEVKKDILDQIKAIEERNKAELDGRKRAIQEEKNYLQLRQQEGKLAAERIDDVGKRKEVLGDVRQKFLEGSSAVKQQEMDYAKFEEELKNQTKELKGVIEAIETSSKREIQEDRINVEKSIRHSDTVNQLAPDIDPLVAFKETYQKELLGVEDKQPRDGLLQYQKNMQTLESMLSSSNIYEGIVGGGRDVANRYTDRGGATGFGALAASSVLGLSMRAIQSSSAYAQSLGQNVGMFGGSIEGYQRGIEWDKNGFRAGYKNPFTDLGVDLQQAAQRRADIGRATGESSRGDAYRSFVLEKGAGLGMGEISSMARLSRGGGMGAYDQTNMTIRALRDSGAIKGSNYSLLPEFLQTLTSLGQQQLETLGEVNQGVNIKMVAGISNLDESFKKPDVLRGVVNNLQGGLTQGQNPQTEALQYSVLSRINPNASLFELQKMREKGLSQEDYAQDYLTQLQDISGGSNERFFMNIMSAFGTSASVAEDIGTGFQEGKLKEVLDKSFETGDVGLQGRAASSAPEIVQSTAKFTAQFQQTGKDLVDGMSQIIDNLMKANEEGGLKAVTLDIAEGVNNTVDEIAKLNPLLKAATEYNKWALNQIRDLTK